MSTGVVFWIVLVGAVTLAAAVACETIIRFAATGDQASYTLTLRDFAVRPFSGGPDAPG